MCLKMLKPRAKSGEIGSLQPNSERHSELSLTMHSPPQIRGFLILLGKSFSAFLYCFK